MRTERTVLAVLERDREVLSPGRGSELADNGGFEARDRDRPCRSTLEPCGIPVILDIHCCRDQEFLVAE